MTDLSTGEFAPHIVVMGVSGCGKSTVAVALADHLTRQLAEGDDFHPPENIAKMSSGVPLMDEDRWPWLRALAAWIAENDAAGRRTVMTCSALRRGYRDELREGAAGVVFVHVDGPAEVIVERLAARSDHFMPSSLLDSQFDTLEPLETDEAGIRVDLSLPPERIVDVALQWVESMNA